MALVALALLGVLAQGGTRHGLVSEKEKQGHLSGAGLEASEPSAQEKSITEDVGNDVIPDRGQGDAAAYMTLVSLMEQHGVKTPGELLILAEQIRAGNGGLTQRAAHALPLFEAVASAANSTEVPMESSIAAAYALGMM